MKTIQLIGIIGNSLLCLSALLILIDFAPHDLLPSYKKTVKAIQKLEEAKNIFGDLPKNINVKMESGEISSDPDIFKILSYFIKKKSPLSSNINWQKAIGVGYSAVKVPVFKHTLDAFHPLYIITVPVDNSDNLNLEPVGQLSDLKEWLKRTHLDSINLTAILLLAVGFLLQIIVTIGGEYASPHSPEPR
jgi:hypothetical protein